LFAYLLSLCLFRHKVFFEEQQMKRKHKFLKSVILPLFIIILWWSCSKLNIWNDYILPSPGKILSVFWSMIKSGELLTHILVSMKRVFTGFILAFILSFVLGVYAGLASKQQIYYNSTLEFLRHIPPISLIPLLILWFGIGEQSKIIIIVLAAFFPMFLNIKKGIQYCDAKLLEVGDTLGFSSIKKFFKITLPYALPDVLVGMQIGFGYSWRAIIGAEMIAAASGLGYLILDSQQMSRSDKIIIGIIIIGLIGILCDRALMAFMNKFLHTKELKND